MATLPKQPITMPKAAKPVPAPNSDFYELAETLPVEELAVVKQVRTFMETKVETPFTTR
jgi:glutaryl-CoA dehydrogenase